MFRPRTVLDTNILISSLWTGPPSRVVQCWRDRRLWLLLSEEILREYLNVLSRFVAPQDLRAWAELLIDANRSIRVVPHELVTAIHQDPADNRFLECAIAGAADVIVSGDRHLLTLGTFRHIPIVTPAQFLKQFS